MQDAWVGNPMLQESAKPISVDFIKEASDVDL
jgi:hypothetical protein